MPEPELTDPELNRLKEAVVAAVMARDAAEDAYDKHQRTIGRDREARKKVMETELTTIYGAETERLKQARTDTFNGETAAQIAFGKAQLERISERRMVEWSRSGWGRKQWLKTGREGMLQVRLRETRMPSNRSWGLPRMGELFIRLFKKDGSEGFHIVSYPASMWKPANWTPPTDADRT